MLKLTGIKKAYVTGDTKVEALKGVDLEFRNNEFVSILGHSGCGKTTLLNVIGGLDRYDEGDLSIKGVSTKKYKSSDWDTYRNHSIGFVFQSYNLIPHQTVLSNVELALTLSGVSKQERKKRAKEALEKVGLGDQLTKKPNQMSGGQMQRVAIARAIVNNPEILLADEPTGALDSETSVQIMEILKEVAEDRLVIMVTHNPELAEQYSNRIVRLTDGLVTSDSNPYNSEEESVQESKEEKKEEAQGEKKGKASMSFFTALALSFNNLMTKKTRTLLTSFAGSIGIIGIALILALSNGVNIFIESIQREALSSYPLTIDSTGMDMNDALSSFTKGSSEELIKHDLDAVYSNTAMAEMTKIFTGGLKENNLTKFREFLESEESGVASYVSDIQYTYSSPMYIYSADTENGATIVNPSPMLDMITGMMGSTLTDNSAISSIMGDSTTQTIASYYNMWRELIDNEELLHEQYDLLAGEWPTEYNEAVLVVDQNNEVTELTLQALGVSDPNEMVDMYMAMQNGETYEPKTVKLSYEEIMGLTFKIVLAPDYYSYDEATKTWVDHQDDDEYVTQLVDNGEEIRIVGVLRPAEGSVSTMVGGSIAYLHTLPEHIIEETQKCEIVKQQMADTDTDVFTGLPFPTEETEAAAQETESTAKTEETAVFETPEVSAIGTDVTHLTGTFTSMSESEIIASIKENTTGEEQALYLETVELMLKDSLSISEKKTLAADFEKILASYSDEEKSAMSEALGYGNVDISKVDTSMMVTFLSSMSTEDKLKMLETMTVGTFGTGAEEGEEAEETGTPEEEPEPDPEPLAKSYDEALELLGVSHVETPLSINIYPINFESKDAITQIIDEYNQKAEDEGREEDKIYYTDYIGIILSSVTKIVNIVSYVLIAFVAISLVVSSIMIGIITYISVLERTKEIGILRSIGASKRDISRVFNAETLVVGFASGVLGIGLTLLAIIPINIILEHLTSLNAAAELPAVAGVVLIIISMVLTFIGGLIPSGIAARKDPVEALRTE